MSKASFKDFVVQKELGRGSFGVVYLVQQASTKEPFVLKRINIGHMHMKFQQAALREVEILKTINHPNIIKYYYSYIEDNVLSIITEYAEAGDLYQLLLKHRQRKTIIAESEIWKILYELASALQYLHKNNIMHRDIKCQNVFLTKNHTVKLGDLGASKLMTAGMQVSRVGTPLYLAPEMIKQQPYDSKIDIWGLGCVVYTLAAHEAPFLGSNLITLGISIINRIPRQLPPPYSKRLNSLVGLLLEKNPQDRPDIKSVIQMISSRKNDDEIVENPVKLKLRPAFDEEVSATKVFKIPRPKALPGIASFSVPFKPVFREKISLKMNIESFSKPEKSLIRCRTERKITAASIEPEKKVVPEAENTCRVFEYRPQSSISGKVEKAFIRPGTARPSLRTIIKSNTVVKINNYQPPIKQSKLKFTISDLIHYEVSST